METMPCAPNIASVTAHAAPPICSSFRAGSPPTPSMTEAMVAPPRTMAAKSAARGVPGEFSTAEVSPPFAPLLHAALPGGLFRARLLDGDRAVHAQLVVTGLGTEELVGAGLRVGNRRRAGFTASLGDRHWLGEALLDGEVVEDLASILERHLERLTGFDGDG